MNATQQELDADLERKRFEAEGFRMVMRRGSHAEKLGAQARRLWLRYWFRSGDFRRKPVRVPHLPRARRASTLTKLGTGPLAIWGREGA